MTLPTIEHAHHRNLFDARNHLQAMRDIHFLQMRNRRTLLAAAGLAPPAAILPTGLLDFGLAHQPIGLAMILGCIASAIYAIVMLVKRHGANAERGKSIYLTDISSYDPQNAVGAVDDMIAAIKTHAYSMQKAADTAIQKLQALRPGTPLSHLRRYGYYPSRPVETRNDKQYTVNRDEDSYDEHWQRMCVALDELRALLKGRTVLTEERVDHALGQLVPPMRTVMRASEIDTARIEYIPARHAPQPVVKKTKKGKGKNGKGEENDQASALPPPEPEQAPVKHEPDALTPVEGMLNASATMTAASLRSLILSFRQADAGLFLDDDQTTGTLVVERHLPALVSAYAVAHEAATGEDRDLVRSDFAHALKTLRDTLEGVMAGHVKAARRMLQDQGRFIDSRHRPSDLSSVGAE